MSEQSEETYQKLGRQLKALRTRSGESLAETSGAVEIEVRDLANFELGTKRPSEDVLLLLISHFGAKDDEAVKLWEMAGYGLAKIPIEHMSNEPASRSGSVDNSESVVYTDVVDIMVNKYGVIMNFMQNSAPNTPPKTVSRVGMSKEHALSVMKILEATLSRTQVSPRQSNKNNE